VLVASTLQLFKNFDFFFFLISTTPVLLTQQDQPLPS
jgi:hypothetical protein